MRGQEVVRTMAPSRHLSSVIGTGAQKLGSNYGPTLLPLREAVSARHHDGKNIVDQIEMGYSQILWLLPTDVTAKDYYVTEVGKNGRAHSRLHVNKRYDEPVSGISYAGWYRSDNTILE